MVAGAMMAGGGRVIVIILSVFLGVVWVGWLRKERVSCGCNSREVLRVERVFGAVESFQNCAFLVVVLARILPTTSAPDSHLPKTAGGKEGDTRADEHEDFIEVVHFCDWLGF